MEKDRIVNEDFAGHNNVNHGSGLRYSGHPDSNNFNAPQYFNQQ